MTGQITVSELDTDVRVEWKMPHFFKLLRYTSIMSTRFHIFNCVCGFLIVPKCDKFICMSLIKWLGSEINVECIMGMKKSDGSETRTEKVEFLLQDFDLTKSLKLIAVEDLLRSRDTMAPDGYLTVFCNVRLIEVFSDPVVNDLRPSLSGIKRKKTADVLSPSTSFQEEKGIASSGDTVPNKALSDLAGNLKDLYFKKSNTDVIFKVKKNKEFSAHKIILCARSEVFAAMFEHDMSEKKSAVVEITDCDSDSFEDFLLFLYTADINIVSSRNVVELYKTSNKYGCKELLKECGRCMVHNMSADTFFDYLALATMCNDSDLLTAVTSFFIKNAKTIFPTTKWLVLLKEHPSLCNELLMKFADAAKLL